MGGAMNRVLYDLHGLAHIAVMAILLVALVVS